MKLRYLIVGILLLVAAAALYAQSTPEPVQMALDDLNARLGRSYTIADINWRWSEKVYEGTNLGCPYFENTSAQPISIVGYQVLFDVDLNQAFEYDYRVVPEQDTVLLCERPAPTPFPTRVLPTLTPTATFTPTEPVTPTAVHCSSKHPSRLVVGEQARVTSGIPNVLREQPGRSGTYLGEIPGEALFMVLEGPLCGGGMAWWRVDYEGQIGWTAEFDSEDYWLESLVTPTLTATLPGQATSTSGLFMTNTPVRFATLTPFTPPPPTAIPTLTLTPHPTATPTLAVCSQGIPPRLVIGQTGRNLPGLPNNIRELPGESSKYVGEIPSEGAFTVLDGPRCASAMNWWQVNYNGIIGWTPEGRDGAYWLEPIVPAQG